VTAAAATMSGGDDDDDQTTMTKKYIVNVFGECVRSVLPRNVVRNAVSFDPRAGALRVNDAVYRVPGNACVVGFGKAVLDMALETERILRGRVNKAVVSVPCGVRPPAGGTRVRAMQAAEHNVPDGRAVENTERIRRAIAELADDDVLIVLVSGGGSALLCSPTVPLADPAAATALLSSSGASIEQVNTVRKALSNVKGGRLIGSVPRSTTVIALILSDVVGDPVHVIASGPTVPNDDPADLPLRIVERYGLQRRMPSTVRRALNGNRPADGAAAGRTAHNHVIGNNAVALRAGVARAQLDYATVLLTGALRGDVTLVAAFYESLVLFVCGAYASHDDYDDGGGASLAELTAAAALVDPRMDVGPVAAAAFEAAASGRGLCALAGGEPTVRVRGRGRGGRNQELALRTSVRLHGHRDRLDRFDVVFFSGGTDGIDGPTDACGAFGCPRLVDDARAHGLDPSRFVDDNDSYGFYSSFRGGRDLLKVGHTGTNVMDVHVLIVRPK